MKKCCLIYAVEQGILERYTLLSISSLKMFGGALAECDIYCYQPRPEFPVSRKTRKFFGDHGIFFSDKPINRKYRFYALANKPLVCLEALHQLDYETYIFFDGDTLVLNEPSLLLQSHFDFAITANYYKGVGTEGSHDSNYRYWSELYALANLPLPGSESYLTLSHDQKRVFPYYNSAVFAFNRHTRVIESWLDLLQKAFIRKLLPQGSIYFLEETTLSAAISKSSASLLSLPLLYNYPILAQIPESQKYLEALHAIDQLTIVHHLDDLPVLIKMMEKYDIESEKIRALLGVIKNLDIYPRTNEQSIVDRYSKYRRMITERSAYFRERLKGFRDY